MNTCIHSASHGTVNSVNTRSAYLPPLYLAPARTPLPPSLPRASQLAARALDGQVELVVRAVGAVRVGVPLSPPAPCSRRAGPSPSGGAPWRGRVRGGVPNPDVCTHTLYSAVYAATAHIHVSYKCIRMSHTYAPSRVGARRPRR